jgi:hypothetical protein
LYFLRECITYTPLLNDVRRSKYLLFFPTAGSPIANANRQAIRERGGVTTSPSATVHAFSLQVRLFIKHLFAV